MAKRKQKSTGDRHIFSNYGILWRRAYIDSVKGRRGKPKKKGQVPVLLLGHLRKKGKKEKWVDFREQIGVYALYDRDERII
ncbi:MAG TPA: hypothetical protein VEW28_00705 [Candidatus Kapabacteria bacterium]|nr:hypothetical protein [Candidatus Kapabacteria bacterium]